MRINSNIQSLIKTRHTGTPGVTSRSGACTMMIDEIQSYRIHFELTRPVQSGFVGTMKLIINFLCQLRLDPELMERVHVMNV